MKKLLVIFLLIILAIPSFAQEKKVPKGYEFYKEKYEENFTSNFETIWNAVLYSLEEIGCQVQNKNTRINDEGLYRGVVQSDFCVFAMGDTTFNVLKKYSLDMPFIRAGKWDNGRLQYKFIVQEKGENNVHLVMTTEMSGFESYVTGKVHFWRSNGILELAMLERIKNNIGKKPAEMN